MPSATVARASVQRQLDSDVTRRRMVALAILLLTLFMAAIAYATAPAPFSVALLVLLLASGACFLRPTLGVYLVVVFTLVGDDVTTSWWPFTKNMSSKESILYVHDALILNPLEVMIGMTLLAWLLQRLVDPTWRFWRGRMFWPLVLFAGFVGLGILYGRFKGADSRVAVFEFRPMLHMVLVYILVTNLVTTRQQYRRILYLAFAAISVQCIFALVYYTRLPGADRELLESLGEHAATVQMNAVMVFVLAAWALGLPHRVRWSAMLVLPVVIWAYLLSQRRAAMVALVVGVILLLVVVFFRRRRAFWFIAPTFGVLGLGFVLATWNAHGALGLPAQAVKTVLFPDQLGTAEQSSDLYREWEAYDIWFTIRQSPLFGVGFGRPFLRPIALPDISFFEFHAYMPHNAVLYVWLKAGFGGFVTLLFAFARAIQRGVRSALLVRTNEQAAIVVTGTAYVVMFLVFAYVDLAWGVRSMVFLGFCFALCGDYEAAIDTRARSTEGVHHHQLATVSA